jgi:hypothetical protein
MMNSPGGDTIRSSLDQEPHDALLFGWEELVPHWIEPNHGHRDVTLRKMHSIKLLLFPKKV